MRAAGVDQLGRGQPRPALTPAFLRMNDHLGTPGLKFAVAWTRLPLEVPAGHVPHYRAAAARVVAPDGKLDRNGGR